MKVLHIYAGNMFGGIETLLVTLAQSRHLCPTMEPHFALCFDGRLADELRSLGASVHLLGAVRVSRPWTVLGAHQALRQLLQQQQFDRVICHACWSQAIFGAVIKAQGVPLVFWCHDALGGKHWLEQLAKWSLPDLAIACSHYTLAAMQSVYPQVKSQVVYGAVAPPLVSDRPTVRQRLRVELYTPADAVVIVQASRLEPWKGHSLLLTALAQLQDVEGWVYWLVGGVQRSQEMDYFESLQAQAHSLGMASRVRFVGQRADVPQLLAAADIHCQPNTKAEPFGIAFIEALYANLPVVTTAIGGALEIVDDTCGCLVEPNHPEMLSQALRGLIGDPDRRSQLSQNGFARARQHCDPRQQMDQLCHILEAIA